MKNWILPVILTLAFVLRIYNLGSLPAGFTPDEASFGYDAYSILKTGKDQWGKPFPLVLESFGDFKSPLYSYLAIPFMFIFGLNEFAVRLPNAILGTLAVYVIYLLVFQVTSSKKIGMFSAFLLAINTWAVMISRGGFEFNLITILIPLGIYLFIKEKYNLSVFVFGLSLFTYHSAKLLVPIIFIFLHVFYRVKRIIPAVIFSIFFAILLYTQTLGGSARIAERSITAGALEAGAKVKIELINNGANPVIARIMHNKYQVTVSRFINNYKQYFSPLFLFTKGPAEYTYGMLPDRGVLYVFEGLLLLGLIPVFRKYKKLILILLSWLLLSPIPAALATGVGYSANRASAMIIPLVILVSLGAVGLLEYFKKYQKQLIFTLATLIVFELILFINNYFVNSFKVASPSMLYGNMEVFRSISGDKKIIVDKSLSEPHIYYAFVNKVDPLMYQEATKSWKYTTWVDQIDEYSLDGVVFKDIKKTDYQLDAVLVGRPSDFPIDFIPDKIINYPDGKPAIYVKNI